MRLPEWILYKRCIWEKQSGKSVLSHFLIAGIFGIFLYGTGSKRSGMGRCGNAARCRRWNCICFQRIIRCSVWFWTVWNHHFPYYCMIRREKHPDWYFPGIFWKAKKILRHGQFMFRSKARVIPIGRQCGKTVWILRHMTMPLDGCVPQTRCWQWKRHSRGLRIRTAFRPAIRNDTRRFCRNIAYPHWIGVWEMEKTKKGKRKYKFF